MLYFILVVIKYCYFFINNLVMVVIIFCFYVFLFLLYKIRKLVGCFCTFSDGFLVILNVFFILFIIRERDVGDN